MATELTKMIKTPKSQRELERERRTVDLHVPTQTRGKLKCPVCSGEKRVLGIKFDFIKSESITLELRLGDRNSRCPHTRGRIDAQYFKLVPVNEHGEELSYGESDFGIPPVASEASEVISEDLSEKEQLKKEVMITKSLTDISGVGIATAEKLRIGGLETIEAIKLATVDEIVLQSGLSLFKVNQIKDTLKKLDE